MGSCALSSESGRGVSVLPSGGSEYPASLRPGIGQEAEPPMQRGYRETARQAGCWLLVVAAAAIISSDKTKKPGVPDLLQHPRWVGTPVWSLTILSCLMLIFCFLSGRSGLSIQLCPEAFQTLQDGSPPTPAAVLFGFGVFS